MKRAYVKPVMEGEMFVANEYVATCYQVFCKGSPKHSHSGLIGDVNKTGKFDIDLSGIVQGGANGPTYTIGNEKHSYVEVVSHAQNNAVNAS